MTAVAVFTQPRRGAIFMVTDGAFYDAHSGAIVFFENKSALVENWPGAVTNTGNAEATGLVVDALGGEFPTWDGMVAGADDFLARVVPTWGLQSGADVILAGMSATRGPEAYTFRIDDELPVLATQEEANASKYWADRPFKLVRLGKLVMAPVPHDQILPANWEGIADDADAAEIEWSTRKLINMQRHMSLPDSIGGIGGFATITKITREGIEQRTLLEWPEDQTGGRIRPRPIDWNKWHRDNPQPARVINLPAQKRKRLSRDRRGLTAQRLQMLGDLASVDEKVRLTELSIIQARQQPGSLVTDTDMQRLRDFAREQEVLSREQTRIGYLGGAANDFDRYAVRLHELDIALKYSKISQDDFNRAVAAAHPLFEPLKSAASEFATGFAHDLRSGVAALDALNNALNRLEDRLIDLALNQAINGLFAKLAGAFGGVDLSTAGVGETGPALGKFVVGHSGGMVGSLTETRYLHPAYFENAPRFAAGLNARAPGINEIPVLAHRGEVIGWPEQMRAAFGGSSARQTVIIQNYSGGEVEEKRETGADGEEIVRIIVGKTLQHISREKTIEKTVRAAFGARERLVRR